MSDLYRLIEPERRGWKDDEWIDQLRNSGVLIPVAINASSAAGWLKALQVASESTAIDLETAGVLDDIRHALVVGKLVEAVNE